METRGKITDHPESQEKPSNAPQNNLNISHATPASSNKKSLSIGETNIANLGSDMEVKCRQAASQGEPGKILSPAFIFASGTELFLYLVQRGKEQELKKESKFGELKSSRLLNGIYDQYFQPLSNLPKKSGH